MTIDEDDIRAMLSTADVPPTGVDVRAVVATGRRRVIWRRAAAASGAVALVAAVGLAAAGPYALRSHRNPVLAARPSPAAGSDASSPPVSSPPVSSPPSPTVVNCAVHRLPVPHGLPVNFDPHLISPNGRYIVAYESSDVVYRSVLWTDGVPAVMNLPGSHGSVEAINSHGVAVVDAYDSGFRGESLYRTAGSASTKLSVPMAGDWHYYEIHMNTAGAIVAYAEPNGNSGGDGAVALLWRVGADLAVKLPIHDPDSVSGVLDDGRIIGVSASSAHSSGYVTVWDANGRNGQRLAPSVPSGQSAVVDAVAGSGFAAGGLYAGPVKNTGGVDWTDAIVWDLRTGARTSLRFVEAPLASVNASGWAVDLYGQVGAANRQIELAVPAGTASVRAEAIADDRTVVGVAVTSADNTSAIPVVWHC